MWFNCCVDKVCSCQSSLMGIFLGVEFGQHHTDPTLDFENGAFQVMLLDFVYWYIVVWWICCHNNWNIRV